MAAHIVNNHIIMAFYIDCIHTDICEQSVITCWLSAIQMLIIQIQAIPHKKKKGLFVQKRLPSYAKIAKLRLFCTNKPKKRFICAKKIAKLRPHQMTGASHSVHHAPSRGSARIQINNLPCIFDFFFLDDLILFGTLPATKSCCFFYHQDAVFERNLFHNGHKQ